MNDEPAQEASLTRALDRLGDLIDEDIEMRRREARRRAAEESQTAVDGYVRRRLDDRPHQYSYLTFARAVPGLLEQFTTTVPGDFWNEDSGEAIIACPCGGTPAVPFNSVRGCDCERVFAYTGREVRVANSPKETTEPARVD